MRGESVGFSRSARYTTAAELPKKATDEDKRQAPRSFGDLDELTGVAFKYPGDVVEAAQKVNRDLGRRSTGPGKAADQTARARNAGIVAQLQALLREPLHAAGCGRCIDDFLLVRYEDMRADPEGQLAKVLHLFGAPVRSEYVREAVAFASVENMRKLEQRRLAWLDGIRMAPGNRANPDSYKVRRAKVGGYRDYFTAEQVAELEALMRARLSPRFGYGNSDPATGAGPAEG
jgi:hypothetical protein